MFKKIVSTPFLVVKHIGRHKGTYLMGSIALALLLANLRASTEFGDFLIEKGIDPNEYFLAPEDFAAIS